MNAKRIPTRAEVDDAERRADTLARRGASAAEVDAADERAEQLHQQFVAALRDDREAR